MSKYIGVYIHGAEISVVTYSDLDQPRRDADGVYENGKDFDPEVDTFLLFEEVCPNQSAECIFSYEHDVYNALKTEEGNNE